MQQNRGQMIYIEEEKIDLREIFATIAKKKRFITIFTAVVTLLAIIFSLIKTPIYEAKAIVKIGEYKINTTNTNTNIILDNASSLVEELKVIFIELLINEKDRISEIKSISTVKGQKNFFTVISHAIDNKEASKEINKVVDFVQEKHQKILREIKEKREKKIFTINKKIKQIIKNELPMIESKMGALKSDIAVYTKSLESVSNNLSKIKDKTPALAMLEINEQQTLTELISSLRNNLIELEDKKIMLETVTLDELKEEIDTIKTLLKPHNYKNTEIIGDIILNDYPVEPKKKLIVIVSFISALILSIFIAFFMEFIKSGKDEVEEKK